MKKQVLSIEQMQTLIDKGIDISEASMCWWIPIKNDIGSPELHISGVNDQFVKIMPTFDLSDILELIPYEITDYNMDKSGLVYSSYMNYNTKNREYVFYWQSETNPYSNTFPEFFNNSPLEAAYQMLLWCIDNGHIKDKEL